MSGLLLGMVLSVCTCVCHNMITLPLQPVYINSGTCLCQCSFSSFTPVSLQKVKYCYDNIIIYVIIIIITASTAVTEIKLLSNTDTMYNKFVVSNFKLPLHRHIFNT
jgi:hypothetical protein